MKIVITTVFLILLGSLLYAQSEEDQPLVTIKSTTAGIVEGYVKEIRDSSLVFLKITTALPAEEVNIQSKDIFNISYSERAESRGEKVGALIGFGVGALVGVMTKPNNPEPDHDFIGVHSATENVGLRAVVGGCLFAFPGMVIGKLSGYAWHEHQIEFNQNKYSEQRDRLKDALLVH